MCTVPCLWCSPAGASYVQSLACVRAQTAGGRRRVIGACGSQVVYHSSHCGAHGPVCPVRVCVCVSARVQCSLRAPLVADATM
eukprot:3136294-Pyramimonas_sp.AAC.1